MAQRSLGEIATRAAADIHAACAMAQRSLAEIATRAAADIHPPLYYWLLSLWTKVFGDSEIAMRSLSALWGLLLVWLVYQIASRLFDKRTALIAALFAAINPFLIAYSQEVRMYEQLAALAALLFYGLVRFIMHESIVLPADGTGKTISFSGTATALVVIASIAGLYTHYTFPVMVGVATLLYLLWVYNSRRRGFVRIRLMHWGLLLIGIAFFYLPWIGTAFKQLTTWPRSGESVPLGDALSQILRLLALGPATKVEANSLWMAIFLLLLILGLWPWVRANGRRAHWLSWGLPLFWLATPVAMVLVGGLYKEAYLKFLLVAVAPFCILMGRGVTGFMEALQHGAWWKPGQRMRAASSRPPAANTRGTANRNNKTTGRPLFRPTPRPPQPSRTPSGNGWRGPGWLRQWCWCRFQRR